jgi:hypothetical protein
LPISAVDLAHLALGPLHGVLGGHVLSHLVVLPLLGGAVEALLEGDVETGKTVLRGNIKAADGREKLGLSIGARPRV